MLTGESNLTHRADCPRLQGTGHRVNRGRRRKLRRGQQPGACGDVASLLERARAVITKSFARIHETNLKKQGILALTFADPKDYEKIEQQDRISVTGLNSLAPGKPVQVTIHKADGNALTIQANHSITAQQIAWFKGGFGAQCVELNSHTKRERYGKQSRQNHLYKDG